MPYNTRKLKVDSYGSPVPQKFNPVIDDYEVLTEMNYYGYSTESKPTNVPKNATFYEYDTGDAYIFTGVTWVVL